MYSFATSVPLCTTGLAQVRFVAVTAGLLCFALDPETHNVYLALGREARYDDVTFDRGVWCDFGGHVEPEETVEEAAVREFCEESLCVLAFENYPETQRASSTYAPALLRMLQNEDYLFKITLMETDEVRSSEEGRVYFVKEVPWQPEFSKRFHDTRSTLLSARSQTAIDGVPYVFRQHPALSTSSLEATLTVNRHYLEKQSVKWWSLDRLREVICKRKGRYKFHRFRKGFLPVLEHFLTRMSA